MGEPFFMVWNPNGGPPTYRHGDLDSAEREAKRLAEKAPGQEFYTLCAVSVAKVREPVEVIRLVSTRADDIIREEHLPF